MAVKFCWFWCMGVAGHKQLVSQLGRLTLDLVGLVTTVINKRKLNY